MAAYKLKVGSRILVVNYDGSRTRGVVDQVSLPWTTVRNMEGYYVGYQRSIHVDSLLRRNGGKI